MAKKIISESYVFLNTARTIVISNKSIKREQLLLIINTKSNIVIYNFSDPSLTATSYIVSTTPGSESTTIQLTYDTTSMSSTDPLSIVIDEPSETFTPTESYRDPVEKFRVSMPQALIDTDFEYGNQSTKWETLALTNNRQSAFYDPTQGISGIATTVSLPNSAPGSYQITGISATAGSRLVTISINNTTGITTNTPIYVQDCTEQVANGWYLPFTVTTNSSIQYYARSNLGVTGSIFDSTKTYLFVGNFYTGAAIPIAAGTGTAFTFAGNIITVTTTNAHGLSPGQAIYVVGTTGTNPPNGAWVVARTPTVNTFTFDTTGATGTPGSAITSALNANLYPRTWGSSIHRAFDGGVTFTAGLPYHGNQLIRQTRRYFRYQSGKGIQFSTGSNLCTPWQVDSIIASGTTVTVTTKFPHNLNAGPNTTIKVSGADGTVSGSSFNGIFTVASIPSETTFTYTVASTPTPATATSLNGFVVQPYQWYGASLRIGMFDSQNGLFFEYDGQKLYAVKRSATSQISGYITTLAQGGQTVTGINTYFSTNLIPGDFIVIRGMTHKVLSIESDTSMTIYPDYRGTSLAAPNRVVINKIIETRIPQSQWNIDKVDGTGPSGMVLDITKMQMWFIDYSWYGAGAVRFGVRNQRGEIIYCHKIVHGNSQTEAYMRSGNLPARYEVNTLYPLTRTTSTLGAADTTINVLSTEGFPSSGSLIIRAPGNTTSAIELVDYTSKTNTSFGGLTRAVINKSGPGGLTGMGGASPASAFTFSATAPTAVEFWGPSVADTISHWGSSVIMDGRYDDDKSFLFNFGINTAYSATTSGVRYPVFSVRLAPAVDSGLTGLLGQREIINRMQLQPFSMGIYATSFPVRVEVLLNARISAGSSFVPVGGSSLAQYAAHVNTQTITGGESIFTFFAPAGGFNSADLSKLRDIGNSILGGGTSLTYPSTDNNKYPDGPDILTICVTPIGGTAGVLARLNWLEAQA